MKKIKKSTTENDNEKIIKPVKNRMARFRAVVTVLLFTYLIAGAIIILKNDLINKKIDEVKNAFFDYVGAKDFALDDVIVTGRKRTKLVDIMNVINLKQGDNLLKTDVKLLKHRLEELPWVRDVDVRKTFFPNILKVDIKEKEILALWQLKGKFYPLDMDGYVIEADYVPDKEVLLVVGEGAGENILELLKKIKSMNADYLPRIKVANFISKRRWNLVMDDAVGGVTVKFPEENFERAWNKLLKLDETKGILKRKLTIIDLRLDDKVIVKLRKNNKNTDRKERQI